MGAGKVLGVPRVSKGSDHLTHDRLAAKVAMTMMMFAVVIMSLLMMMMSII